MSRTSSGESFYSAVSHLSKPSAKLIDSCPVDIFYEHREYLKKWNVEQEISTLEDVTENLHLINHWLHKEIHKTENKCKYVPHICNF